jgi:sec-independent protein translocase protein TatA
MGSLSLGHWLVILLVIAILFGPGRLASIGKGLGEGIRNLKKGLEGTDEERGHGGSPPALPTNQPGAKAESKDGK